MEPWVFPGGYLPLGFRAANSFAQQHTGREGLDCPGAADCSSLSEPVSKQLVTSCLVHLEKMVPEFTEIIWVDRNSIRERQWHHQINTWASQINVLALDLSLYSGGPCSQTETLNGTDILFPTTANSLFLMRSQVETWYVKDNSSRTFINCEFYNVYCGTPLGNNVKKPRERNCMLGMNAGYKNKPFYTHVHSSIFHNS